MCRSLRDVVCPRVGRDGAAGRCSRDRPSEYLQEALPKDYSLPTFREHHPFRAAFVPWWRRLSRAANSPTIRLKQTRREVVNTRSAHTSSVWLPLARDRVQQTKLRQPQVTAGKHPRYHVGARSLR